MLCPNHIAYQLCVFGDEGRVFKGNAKGHIESLGPVSTASYIPLP